MSQFGVDGQSVHLETECHSSKLSQQMVRWVDASFGSKCHVVGLSVDRSSRHRIETSGESHVRVDIKGAYPGASASIVVHVSGKS